MVDYITFKKMNPGEQAKVSAYQYEQKQKYEAMFSEDPYGDGTLDLSEVPAPEYTAIIVGNVELSVKTGYWHMIPEMYREKTGKDYYTCGKIWEIKK